MKTPCYASKDRYENNDWFNAPPNGYNIRIQRSAGIVRPENMGHNYSC